MIEAARTASLFKDEVPEDTPTQPLLLDEIDRDTEESTVLDFVSVSGVARGLIANDWTNEVEIGVYSNIARDAGADDRVKILAAREIRKITMQALTLRGAVKKVDAVAESNGQRVQVTGHMLDAGAADTARLLEAAKESDRVLNALPSHLDEQDQQQGDEDDEQEISGGFTKRAEGGTGFDHNAVPDNYEGTADEDEGVSAIIRELSSDEE